MYHIIKYKKRYKKALSSQAVKCIVTLAKKKNVIFTLQKDFIMLINIYSCEYVESS